MTRAGDAEPRLADGAPFARGERAEARGRLAPRRAERLRAPGGRDAGDAVDAAGVRDPGEVERQRAPAGVDHRRGVDGRQPRDGELLRVRERATSGLLLERALGLDGIGAHRRAPGAPPPTPSSPLAPVSADGW